MAKHSFYLPGGGLPRGGLAAVVQSRGLDGDGDDAPDAVELREMLLHRFASGAGANLDDAMRQARAYLAAGRHDDTEEEYLQLAATVRRIEAVSTPTATPAPTLSLPVTVGSLGTAPSLGDSLRAMLPLLLLGGGIVALVWLLNRDGDEGDDA
jgi:hypothetical protein